MVAYRDHPDAYEIYFQQNGISGQAAPWHYKILPWTVDPDEVQRFIGELEAADYPQDVAEDVSLAMLKVITPAAIYGSMICHWIS